MRTGSQGNHCETILEQTIEQPLPDPLTSLTVRATVTEDITGAIADSVNYTVEELRAGLRQALVEYHGNEAEQKFEDALLGQVVENLAVELPPVMLERQMDGMLEDFDKRLQQQGLSVDGYIEMLQTDRATFRESYREVGRQLARGYVEGLRLCTR